MQSSGVTELGGLVCAGVCVLVCVCARVRVRVLVCVCTCVSACLMHHICTHTHTHTIRRSRLQRYYLPSTSLLTVRRGHWQRTQGRHAVEEGEGLGEA